MNDRKAELGIGGPRPVAAVALDHDQPAIDLAPPVHPGGVFLADEAAFGETDAVQLGRVAFQPEQVAKLGAAFAGPETEAVFQPALGGRRCGAKPAAAKLWKARVDDPYLSILRPVRGQVVIPLNSDRPPEAVNAEALDKVVRRLRLAIEQEAVAILPDHEVEQAFALRREKPAQTGKRRQPPG